MDSESDHDSWGDEEGFWETPFNLEDGIRFKFGMSFINREAEIAKFEEHLGFALPADFLNMIDDWCEGGFDGWYKVKKVEFGTINWDHLLLMRLPIAVDYEWDEDLKALPGMKGFATHITTRLLEQNPSLFYTTLELISYFPFGTAICYKPADKTGTSGYLVFDRENENKVRYVSNEEPRYLEIADTFSEMMANSVFESFG